MSTITIHLAIKGTAQQIWQALVDGEITPQYYVGFAADSTSHLVRHIGTRLGAAT